MKTLLLVSMILGAVGLQCPGPAPVVPTPDASDASTIGDALDPCVAACQALAIAGCPMGVTASCPTFMSSLAASQKVPNAATQKPITCQDVALVRTRTDALKLGFTCQ